MISSQLCANSDYAWSNKPKLTVICASSFYSIHLAVHWSPCLSSAADCNCRAYTLDYPSCHPMYPLDWNEIFEAVGAWWANGVGMIRCHDRLFGFICSCWRVRAGLWSGWACGRSGRARFILRSRPCPGLDGCWSPKETPTLHYAGPQVPHTHVKTSQIVATTTNPHCSICASIVILPSHHLFKKWNYSNATGPKALASRPLMYRYISWGCVDLRREETCGARCRGLCWLSWLLYGDCRTWQRFINDVNDSDCHCWY